MQWRGRKESANVEDRRKMSTGGLAAGGGVIGVILYLLITLLGEDPSQIQLPPSRAQMQERNSDSASEDTLMQYVSVVLSETETTWQSILQENGITYQPPILVIYRDIVQSGCGSADASTGPFYCPADQKLYIDLSFYAQLRNRFGAPGDFAMAYVIAHEVGHYVQNLLGVTSQMDVLRQRYSAEQYNRFSIKVELQADYYAGVWAHFAERKNILDEGDIQEALSAAAAVGDDNIQIQSGSEVKPETFTHGTSQQRMNWFKKGYNFGDLENGDTFNHPI
jgi:predicted metalloprotease